MTKRSILFYILIILFVITVVITILGVTKVIAIDDFYLKGLFSAFLIELAAAVYSLVRQGDLLSEGDKKGNTQAKTISSAEWFEAISEKLSDCGYARLYLRSFDHPDDFKGEHKEKLNSIIENILEKIKSGADIKVISFAPDPNVITGLDWINSKIDNSELLVEKIKILKSQPVSNSSSMYLFDDKSVIYNKKIDGKTTYHVDNYSNSIVHELMVRGFEVIEGDAS